MNYSTDWLPRVQLLMQQNRLPQAADELRRQLSLDLARAGGALPAGRVPAGRRATPTPSPGRSRAGHSPGPEYDFAFYVLALVQHRRHRPAEALAAINQALALDPADANYYHLLGQLRLESGQWQAALQAARTGLGFDSEHADLHGLEARALACQGRGQEASEAARAALGHGAESSSIQAQAGWVALETNRLEGGPRPLPRSPAPRPDFRLRPRRASGGAQGPLLGVSHVYAVHVLGQFAEHGAAARGCCWGPTWWRASCPGCCPSTWFLPT
ncbi:MAG: tetratricopeptide repeat protein [Hymenobacter sp.]